MCHTHTYTHTSAHKHARSIAAFSMVSPSSHLERKTSRSKIAERDEPSESNFLTEGRFEGTEKCGTLSLKITCLSNAHAYLKLHLC